MPNHFVHIYQIYDFETHFVDNIFKGAWIHFLHTVKWFQLLLSNSNNSIPHQSFDYTQLNDQTVLFQTIQLSISQS